MNCPAAPLDANVLYPAGLRDFLLRLVDQYLYAPLWSPDINAESIGSFLADRPDLTAAVLERTRAVMDRHFPDTVVTGYSDRAAGLELPDPGDLHVLAAAIEGGVDLIVTRNLRDFPLDYLPSHVLTAQPVWRFLRPAPRPAGRRIGRRRQRPHDAGIQSGSDAARTAPGYGDERTGRAGFPR